jgi:preprotein translocase subunit SecA
MAGTEGFEKFLRFGEGRRMKRLQQQAAYITTLEPQFQTLSDDELRAKTTEFRERLANGEDLNEMLFEAYAAVREARIRESDQRMFDVQLMGGIVLHEGDVAEMKTGEGKTFVASLALYLNALPTVTTYDGRTIGQGVHLVTVNDYLAQRDAEWNRGVYERLGLNVAFIETQMSFDERKLAYEADITYGTNSEFGFDYLRDNMSSALEGLVQRGHPYAIVDEVDSILIDEARTPLIISGEPTTAAKTYYDFARVAKTLNGAQVTNKKIEDQELAREYDFLYDEKHKTVAPTELGIDKVERLLKIEHLYDPRNVQLVNHLSQSLKAEALYKRDVDYVIEDGEVKIVDEFTGRIMEGRRWSEGLHQAVEAKENVPIQEEHQTLATITLQNYFRLYEKLAGMTGTAKTEEKEFVEIYGLEVIPIPTNVGVARKDENDLIFKTKEAKFAAVAADIKERNATGQPILVGTIAVETSEYLAELLKRQGVPHNVLNAKEHAREAEIIKDAGQIGAVTIATNMAGRGVDIKIDDQVRELGGLYVLGTERHESRRIDNQLRGRSGRQGDPGETRFYLSGQDDLVRLFAGDRIYNIMERFKLPEDQPMEAKILSNQIENAQKKVEEQNFVQRKNVLKYDDVMNVQRRVIYEQRRKVLEGADLSEEIKEEWLPEVIASTASEYLSDDVQDNWDLDGLVTVMDALYGTGVTSEELRGLDRDAIVEEFLDDASDAYREREKEIEGLNEGLMRELERYIVLQVVDIRWREHLENMDYMREGIHLRGMAQKDPLVEYRNEGHIMFLELNDSIRTEVISLLFHMPVEVVPADEDAMAALPPSGGNGGGPNGNLTYEHGSLAGADAIAAAGAGAGAVGTALALEGDGAPAQQTVVKAEHENIGRNDPCWCGSGKKFKRCHGA